MRPLIAIVAAVSLAPSLAGAAGMSPEEVRAQPGAFVYAEQPVPPIGRLAQAVHDDEICSRVISGAGASVVIEVTPAAEEAIRDIHQERGRFYAQGNGPSAMARLDARMRAGPRPEASLFLRINDSGTLLGLVTKSNDDYQPIRIGGVDLNTGQSARVVISAAKSNAGRSLAVLSYNASGKLHSMMLIDAFAFRAVRIE